MQPEGTQTSRQEIPDRFGGIARLYGREAFHTFQRARVAVIGVGGVGSWAAEALTRSGVGDITLLDMDDICVSNTNRQVHTLRSTVGQQKVEAMRERLLQINPDCRVSDRSLFVTAANVAKELAGMDYVIDAIDSVRHKCAIIHHCQRHRIRVVTAGAAGGKTDPTLIRCADLSRTFHDPLLAKVRRILRQEFGFPTNPQRRFGIEAVFSEEQAVQPAPENIACPASSDHMAADHAQSSELDLPTGSFDTPFGVNHDPVRPAMRSSLKLDCAGGYGAATTVTATFGLVAVSRVLRRLADRS